MVFFFTPSVKFMNSSFPIGVRCIILSFEKNYDFWISQIAVFLDNEILSEEIPLQKEYTCKIRCVKLCKVV